MLYLKNRINTEENNEMTQLEYLENEWMKWIESYNDTCDMIGRGLIKGDRVEIEYNLAVERMSNAFCAYSVARVRANKDGE